MRSNGGRPEENAPPEVWYDATEAAKYTSNTRMRSVQTQLSERCYELLALPPSAPSLLLDVGCGSCLSMANLPPCVSCIGIDISGDMLSIGLDEGNCAGNALLGDIGQGLPFTDEVFDGVISVSAIQWLCNADTSNAQPRKRLLRFFRELYRVLAPGCRAALQFYPASEQQADLIVSQAMRAGFTGGVVVDFPNSTKAKKHFLVITAGAPSIHTYNRAASASTSASADAHTNSSEKMQIDVGTREPLSRGKQHSKKQLQKDKKQVKGGKQWVLKKKERHKRVGKEVKADSKYSGRKRKRKPI